MNREALRAGSPASSCPFTTGGPTAAPAPAFSQSAAPLHACLQRATRSAGSVAVVVLVDFEPAATLWAWSRLVLQGLPLRAVPGLRFAKVLGSGEAGGFGVKPSRTHQGLFLGFDAEGAAHDFIDHSPVLAAYRSRAREMCVAALRATGSRGSWSGAAMEITAESAAGAPMAALTRASIRPSRAREFWRLSPPAEASLAQAPGCRLAAGLGEAPWLRQATFSLWDSAQAMDAYARSGAHLQAIRASYGGGHFSEAMFVRFVPLRLQGRWQGRPHDG